jgi:hypothetical protein
MFEKFSRSWALVKASAAVLRSDKELMIFPLISAGACVLVFLTFLVPTITLNMFASEAGPLHFILAFLFYFAQYTVIIFFNCALVGAAMIRLDGGDPTLKDGIDIAKSRIGPILGYAAIAATVGLILQMLRDKENNIVVRLLGSALGAAWTLATFLVVPVLVSQDIGPIDALKRSLALMKKTWGENIIGTAGIGLVFSVIASVVVVLGVVLTVAASAVAWQLGLAVGALAVLAVVLLLIYQAALAGIYSAALYRFATEGDAPAGFGELQGAFVAKG